MSSIMPADLREFLESQKGSPLPKSRFFFEEKFELYLRAGLYSTGNKIQDCITIARIQVHTPFQRTGVFKELLNTLEFYAVKFKYDAIVVECIHNQILFDYLKNNCNFKQCETPLENNMFLQFNHNN